MAAAVLHDEKLFLDHELRQRREAGYPPFTRLATVLFSGPKEDEVEAAATRVRDALEAPAEAEGVELLGPAPQALARLRGRHRWHLLLKAKDAARLRAVVRRALEQADAARLKGVTVMADVDPVEVL